MIRLAAIVLFAVGSAAPAHPDVTPTPSRLYLTGIGAELRGGTFSIDLQQVNVDGEGVAWSTVLITKKDPVHGSLCLVQRLKVGEFLGLTSKPSGDCRRRFPGKLGELLDSGNPVEFDPQAIVVSARRYPDWPVLSCHLVSIPGGSGCLEMVKRRVRIPVNEIVVREKSGRRIVIRAPGPRDQMPSDEICSVHGGKIPARMLTEAEKNEARATLRLSAADDDWISRNPEVRKRAREAYYELLKEYPSEPIVEKNRERITARSKAEIED